MSHNKKNKNKKEYHVKKNLSWFWDKYWVPIHVVICWIVIIVGLVWYKADNNTVIKRYNNGICRDCGGEYKYDQAVGHYRSTTYIYKCNKCGNIIELDSELNKYVLSKEK